MPRGRRRVMGAAIAAVAAVAMTLAGGDAAAQTDDEIVVAVLEVEPFVVRDGDLPGGFMYDVWEQIAAQLDLDVEVRWIDTLDDLRDAVESGEVDVAVAPLSSSEVRERRVDFTSPVVTSGPVFAVHERTTSPFTLTQAVFNFDVLRLVLVGFVGLLVLGHLEWWFERRDPDGDFDPDYVRGVWDGIWWAMVTVTTVGYGDSTPRTDRGRVTAMVAMIGSLFLAGAFVAEITTNLQSGRASVVASTLDDVGDQRVGVVEGALYQALLDEQGIETVAYPTQRDAFAGADAGDVDVVVADLFTVRAIGSEFGLQSQDEVLYEDPISYVVPQGSELREDINAVLSTLRQQGAVGRSVDRWTD